MASSINPGNSRLRAIPSGVWALGFVSLLMDTSSEMIHALLPVYLVTAMGASMLTVGVIEGVAEATAAITKIFSGALSDRLGQRKLLAALGYGLAAITKPVFPLAPTVEWIFAARFVDRIGKGLRGAPRDALVADLSPPELRGASFGLRQALDTVGAFLGPLVAIALMWLWHDDFRSVFWVAVIPALACVVLILAAVREPQRPRDLRQVRSPLSPAELARLGPACWWVIAISGLFTLARFSEAFLILRATGLGLPLALTPAVLVTMNVVYALAAYPAGSLSDRMDRNTILAAGIGVLIIADIVLAFAGGLVAAAIGIVLWGVHMALTQGLMSALVADTAPSELRGTAFGMFNLVGGLALLAASLIAGGLWDVIGPDATFGTGAALAALALAALMAVRGRITARDAGQP